MTDTPDQLIEMIKQLTGADGAIIMLRKDDPEQGSLVQFITDNMTEAQINGMFLSGIYSNMHNARMKRLADSEQS